MLGRSAGPTRSARLWAFLKVLVRETQEDRLLGLAAEVSFWGVFSLFPALLIASGLLGVLGTLFGEEVAQGVEARVLSALGKMLTDKGAGVIDGVRALFHANSGGLLTAATVVAIWSVSAGFATVIEALEVIYDVERPRGWFNQRLLAVGMGVGSVVVLVVTSLMLLAGPLFGDGPAIAAGQGASDGYLQASSWLRAPLAFGALALWATALFRFAPRRSSTWRRELPGGILAAVLAVAGSLGFRVYIALAIKGNQVLGVLGGGLILLLWFYLLSVVLMLGGEVNAVLAQRRPKKATPAPPMEPSGPRSEAC